MLKVIEYSPSSDSSITTHSMATVDTSATRSGWYTFAIVMIILGGLAVLFTLIDVLADDWHRNWTPFFIVLGGYLMELGFWAIVMLLADIKLGIDKIQLKNK